MDLRVPQEDNEGLGLDRVGPLAESETTKQGGRSQVITVSEG
jgi:hypothetical protein